MLANLIFTEREYSSRGILNVNKTLKQWEKRQWRPDFGDTNKLSHEQPLGPH